MGNSFVKIVNQSIFDKDCSDIPFFIPCQRQRSYSYRFGAVHLSSVITKLVLISKNLYCKCVSVVV